MIRKTTPRPTTRKATSNVRKSGPRRTPRKGKAATGPDRAAVAAAGAELAAQAGPAASPAPEAASEAVRPSSRKPRENTKQALLIAMLRRPEGATINEITAATGWLSHTVRGAIAGALKKKLGLTVTSEKIEGRGRVYRIGG